MHSKKTTSVGAKSIWPIMAGPIFSTFWLGQSLAAGPVLAGPSGWAKWLGHILAGLILLDRYYGWAYGWVIDWPSQFFFHFGWANNGPAINLAQLIRGLLLGGNPY